jgi:hypothetical protein
MTPIVQTWKEVEEHYIKLDAAGQGHDKMLGLARHIASADYSNRIYALTSLDKLIVGIYNPMEFERETLHIVFDRDKQKWHFTYFSMPFMPPAFQREYDSEEGIEKFDDFIKVAVW